MSIIRSRKHELFTEEVNKLRYLLTMIKGTYYKME